MPHSERVCPVNYARLYSPHRAKKLFLSADMYESAANYAPLRMYLSRLGRKLRSRLQ